jgi:hypothetical protein
MLYEIGFGVWMVIFSFGGLMYMSSRNKKLKVEE